MPSAFCLPAQRQRDWQQHDQIYTAYQHFMRQLYSDWSVRTENPWEADLFYVPALTYFYSGGCKWGRWWACPHSCAAPRH